MNQIVDDLIGGLRLSRPDDEAAVLVIGHALMCLDSIARSLVKLSEPVRIVNDFTAFGPCTLSEEQKEALRRMGEESFTR